jgi:hypothetical protein
MAEIRQPIGKPVLPNLYQAMAIASAFVGDSTKKRTT